MANRKLLTLDDLYNFYSTKKKSMKFSADKAGYNLSVQIKGNFELVDDNEEGLMFCRVKAFHDLDNRNKSYIDTDVLKEKMYSINNRPVLADIVEVEDSNGNTVKDFSGHTMEFDQENDKINYIEIPVGHFINPENISLEYDETYKRSFVYCDAVIYEEYTDACEILRRRESTDVSVELCIRDLEYNCANKVLELKDFYVQGCTLLGETVAPGMAGSKLSLKDFSTENNSMFSNETDEMKEKLIEMQESINSLLSRFNINEGSNESKENYGKEENIQVEDQILVNEEVVEEATVEMEEVTEGSVEVTETESTEEATDTVTENESEEPVEETPDVVVEESVEEIIETQEASEEFVEDDKDDDKDDIDDTDDKNDEDEEKEVFSKTFELSHDDIKYGLYQLLIPYEEANNDWYWIVEVFDAYFVYQGCMGNYFGQKYVKENDSIAFDGEPYALYSEFLTESERVALTEMRSNYSSISAELNSYKEAESIADKMTVFEDKAYASYLETDEFKSLMEKETVKQFSKEELVEKADAALGKLVKTSKTFSMKEENVEPKKPAFFAFAQQTKDTSFLDGLLKK